MLGLLGGLPGLGVLTGLADARGKSKQTEAELAQAEANAKTGKSWDVPTFNAWDYLTEPAVRGAQGMMAATQAVGGMGGMGGGGDISGWTDLGNGIETSALKQPDFEFYDASLGKQAKRTKGVY